MKLGALSLCLATVAACGGAFTTPGNDGGIGGGAGRGGQAGTLGGGAGDLGGHPGTGGFGGIAGDLGGAAGAAGGRGGAGGSGGVAGSLGTGGATVDAGIDLTACNGPGQCAAVSTSCCPYCGQPEVSNFVGINNQYVTKYRSDHCPVALPCAACATIDNPNIGARCIQNHCQVFDARTVPEYSACRVDTDCVLRSGLQCCECGPSSGWLGVSQSGRGALEKAMCVPDGACPACAPIPPTGAKAVCAAGTCTMTLPALL